MNKLIDFLGGVKVVEEVESPINGKISVIRSFAFGTYMQVGGLTQTGGVVNDVWRKSIKKISNFKFKVDNCLVLGLGGGGNAGIVRSIWNDSKIVGVDIDPMMVGMGKKYFHLDEIKIDIKISDAENFLLQNRGKRYNLVLVDLYVGDNYPSKFESDEFIISVKNSLEVGGIAIFNRLYYGEKRKHAVKFLSKLEKIFSNVDVVYPEANVMYICYTSK